MISAKDIYFSYDNTKVLQGIDLSIEKGEFVSILGNSGAGKTTLLYLIGALQKVDSGNLIINNIEINKMRSDELSNFRNKEIGFVFQFHNLLPEFTAFENICLPAYIKGDNQIEIHRKASELLKILNINNRSHHKPSELSGGEQQRVAVARALINSPSIMLADEPSGNLDSKNADDLYKLFLNLNKNLNQTIVLTTHNDRLAKLTHRSLRIKDGKII